MALSSGFEKQSLERVAANGGGSKLREQAFERFEAMPLPSAETEEWRYTDLSDLLLDTFSLDGQEPDAASLDQVAPAAQQALGEVGDRSGLAVQHNSSLVLAHLDPAAEKAGVRFGSIDAALREDPALVEGRLHSAVPFDRTKFTALHAAFRTGGTFV